MAGVFNDNKARLDQEGRLSLGVGDDAAANSFDATHKYALADIFVPVPLSSLLIAEATTTALFYGFDEGTQVKSPYVAGAVGGTPIILLDTASKAYKALAPLVPPAGFRQFSGLDLSRGAVDAPHGAKLLSVTVTYRPVTAAITALTGVFFTEAMDVSAASGGVVGAPRAAQAAYGGTVLYEQPIGTAVLAASLMMAAPTTAANFFTVKVKPTTPAFINDPYTNLFFQLNLTTGAGDCEIAQLVAHWAVALY